MPLWDEAAKISLGGVEVYAFGLFAALGTAAAFGVIGFLSKRRQLKAGTASLTTLLCILIGGLVSRIVFCLLNRDLGFMMPLFSWFQITGGGWSMMGLVGGCMLAAWLSAKWLGEKPGQTLDLAGCALPVFMMFERAAERWIPEFDYSRALESEWLGRSFLAIQDGPDANLATWRLAAAFAAGLFIWLFVCAMTNPGRPGDICIRFLLFFGAGSVILESLRYDMFLSISFVGIQEILALVILCAGVIAAVRQAEPGLQRLKTAALVSLPVAGLIGLGLEFALDRTTINKFLIYAVMIAVMFTPAFLGLRLIRRKGIKQA